MISYGKGWAGECSNTKPGSALVIRFGFGFVQPQET